MHELGITRNVVAICAEQSGGARVTRVRLEIGKQAGVLAQSIRFCFDICAQGTLVGLHLFLLPNPQRWKRALARGGSPKCWIHMSFLLLVLWSASPRQLDVDFTR